MTRMTNQWLAADAEKAAVERTILIYTPVWVVAVACVMLSGALRTWNDPIAMTFGVGVAVPMWLLPWLRTRNMVDPKRTWLKLNAAVAVMVMVGSYFYTHYFFEFMGMWYGFPTTWHWEAQGMGHPDNEVPLFLYPLTHAYFATYYVATACVVRRVRRKWGAHAYVMFPALLVVSYVVAMLETLGMANALLQPYFGYADRTKMLWVGSLGYCLIFVVSIPLLFAIDERWDRDEPTSTPMGRVLLHACAAGMLGFVLLDIWATLIGRLAPPQRVPPGVEVVLGAHDTVAPAP